MNNIISGIVAGAVGGVLLALVVHLAGYIDTAGRIIRMEGAAAGWVTLIVVGALLGLLYALLFVRAQLTPGSGLVYGLVYGVVWWVLGTLVILPLSLGQPAFAFGAATGANFVGYALFGLALGFLYPSLKGTVQQSPTEPTEPTEPTSTTTADS